MWWKCKKCGHEWKAVISSRTHGYGCPECGKKSVSKARRRPSIGGSLIELYPEVAISWNHERNGGLQCDEIAAYSGQMVWWKCKEGHEWKASVSNRVKGRNCPYCSNKKIIAGYNDFATRYPELAKEWNNEKNMELRPTQFAPSSSKKVWWKCIVCGHEWTTSINNRVKRGCPNCSKARTVSFPEKVIFYYMKKIFCEVIENYRPDFLEGRELDIFIPDINLAIEYDGTLYHQNVEKDVYKQNRCQENNILLIRIREPGCPALANSQYVIELSARDMTAYENMITDIIKILSSEKILHDISLDINLQRDSAEIKQLINYQSVDDSIFSTNPELIDYWDSLKNKDFTMNKVTHSSDKEVWWKCPHCQYEWKRKVYEISDKRRKSICPQCKIKNEN